MKNIQITVFEHPGAPVFVMPPFTYFQELKKWNNVFLDTLIFNYARHVWGHL